MPDKIDLLIDILFDNTAREDEKDDAAMDLGLCNDDRALIALLEIASNPNENETVLDSCGESIAKILFKRGKYNKEMLDKLAPTAKSAAYSFLNIDLT